MSASKPKIALSLSSKPNDLLAWKTPRANAKDSNMTTTTRTNTPTAKAKPTYSVMPYNFAFMDWSKTTNEQPGSPVDLNGTTCDKTGQSNIPTKPTESKKRVTKKSVEEKFKLKKTEFHEALLEIYRCGLECKTAIAKIEASIAEPVTNAAIPGLAKILGTYRTYFDNAEEVEKANLFKILVQKCQTDFGKSTVIKSDKRTTE